MFRIQTVILTDQCRDGWSRRRQVVCIINALDNPRLLLVVETLTQHDERSWAGTGKQHVQQLTTSFLPGCLCQYFVLLFKRHDFLLEQPVHNATLRVHLRHKVCVHPYDLCSDHVVRRNSLQTSHKMYKGDWKREKRQRETVKTAGVDNARTFGIDHSDKFRSHFAILVYCYLFLM